MGKTANVFLLILIMAAVVIGQTITPIYDIQYTTDPSGDSPLASQVVTVKGVVTAEHRGDVRENGGISGSYFFMMDSAKAWSGIQIYYSDEMVAEGDTVEVTGTVSEYYGQTQIGSVTSLIIHSTNNPVLDPVDVTVAEAASEAFEDCLVRISDLTIVETDIGSYGEWKISDTADTIQVSTRAKFYYTPVLADPVKSVAGIILYSYGQFLIAPRLAWDIVEGGKYTRIQRIQQVRNSDLLKAFTDEESDISYALNDTLSIKGVVTMPTGLSYAGAGIKFLLSEPEGGPWSGILSYNADSTAYPVLLEGDLIEMTGYIFEYSTGPANMTEFFINSPINILDMGLPLPAPDKVNTGDLRLPETAEQWGTGFVYVQNADIVNYGTAYELYGLDDGTGVVLVDDDSDSIGTYYASNPLPPLGTPADSVRGWVYHHYGSYADTSAYKLEPLYMSDINFGAGPPTVSDVKHDIGIPTASDAVTVSATISTKGTIQEAALYYEVLTGGVSAGYNKVVMSNTDGEIYAGEIPATAEDNFVNYFVVATDVLDQKTMVPADTSVQNYCYLVTDGNLTIADIQYTPWYIADSPFEGVSVEITGTVTTDTAANHHYEAYSIQDNESPWSGIFAFGINADLYIGDNVTVYGTVTDYNPDWSFKWDNNTVILTDSIKINSTGNSVNPLILTTGEIATDTSTAEQNESIFVEIQNAVLTSLNSYDVSFDDGSGECLVDGDFLVGDDGEANLKFFINHDGGYIVVYGDTVHIGEKVDLLRGIYTYSFGTFKISVRNETDFGSVVGIDKNIKAAPKTYALHQNYPNPFNPETKIYFEIPAAQKVKIMVYNVLGQKVRSLVSEEFNGGSHVINWDGRNDFGHRLPSGVYIYRIKAGNFIEAKKMMMVK